MQMRTGKGPLRVLKSILGTDQLSVAIAAMGVCVALGNIVVFNIIDISSRPKPPLWQAVAAGLALSIFLIPFFFLAVSRTLPFMSPWKGIAILAAAMIAPIIMQRMSALGVTDPLLFFAGSFGPLVITLLIILIMRWMNQKRHESRASLVSDEPTSPHPSPPTPSRRSSP